jgi:hypothetical protein
MNADARQASEAIAVTDSGFGKVRRAVFRLTANAAERLMQNLQYRQAAIRNAMPTKIAMISIPKIEKPRAWLMRLSPVAILSRLCRLSNRSAIRAFDPDA